jgi:hypothetical protein
LVLSSAYDAGMELIHFERAALGCERRAAELDFIESDLAPEQEVLLLGATRAETAARERRAAEGYRAASRALQREAAAL